ncbi:hypothetical protein [Pseudoneobacillus sp. C159]
MTRTIIGGMIFLGGLFVSLAIIISGAIYATGMTAWSGKSKLWYAIFGTKQYGNEVSQSLFMGFPFIVGILLAILGLAILVNEYYSSFKE